MTFLARIPNCLDMFGRASITIRATITAAASVALTLAIATTTSNLLGGEVAGTGLFLCILCPLIIAGPASALQFWQQDRLREARRALAIAKSEAEQSNLHLQKAFAALQHRVQFDRLTGILNRDAFTAALKTMLQSQSGTLLFLDADHFKLINDRYGHLSGDEALQAIADAIAIALREGDLLGRIGGEEFAVFLPDTDGEAAIAIAEAIRAEVRSTNLKSEAGESIGLSISIGGAAAGPDMDLQAAWRKADRHLYRAKAMGRDRAVFGDDVLSSSRTAGSRECRQPHLVM